MCGMSLWFIYGSDKECEKRKWWNANSKLRHNGYGRIYFLQGLWKAEKNYFQCRLSFSTLFVYMLSVVFFSINLMEKHILINNSSFIIQFFVLFYSFWHFCWVSTPFFLNCYVLFILQKKMIWHEKFPVGVQNEI